MQENSKQSENLVGIELKKNEIIAVYLGKSGDLIDSFKTQIEIEEDKLLQLISFLIELKSRFSFGQKVGIAVPGLLNRKTNKVAYSTLIPEIAEIDFLSELEKATKLEVFIENDANAAAYAEYVLGAGRGSKNLFYVTLGAGIGGALVFNDKLWHGASGFAGEFGHIAIDSEGLKLEDVSSSANIVQRTKSWFHKDHTSSLNSIGEENITITDIVREAKNEDDFAKLMLERTGIYIGSAIAGVINLLNIEKIVVGGEIMKAEKVVLDSIIIRARKLSFKPSFEAVEIVAGKLGEKASAIGVALLSDIESL